MNVRITQLDGSLPNLALMRISAWHKAQGDSVYFTRDAERDLFEPECERVYGSAIFAFSSEKLKRFRATFPNAILGGTGTGSQQTVEQLIGDFAELDYSLYPEFNASIGFTQRGCRLSCKFCVVPAKEGKPKSTSTIAQIWRGEPYPKHLHLLDNDFFGNPDWRERIAEIRNGGFKVCLSQGINVRMITPESAAALASIEYRSTKFNKRTLYTAWDNLKDETVFFRGIDSLEAAGIPAKNVRAYMLIGFDPAETWQRIWQRFNRMVEREIEPYPMVFDRSRTDLICFQRWVISGLYRFVPWKDYERSTKSQESVDALAEATA